ncbi:hypothetical protein [Spirosoma sp. KNUC1025]|uniref:hypothetical protein n=1 Tax=Spirosoma sp. KNUC1025 TaxID=2894082 RepID=UPI0038698E71|nr:hypothetical protein LN737_04910 [Spirosoma sp. KNUC1025]
MRKTSVSVLFSAIVFVGLLAGCKKESTPPVSELIAKVWTASKVEENNVTVYTKGATGNIRDYTKFSLDLSSAPTAKYTDYDGVQSTGKYSLPSDTRLSITDMNPQLTGTNGTIEFTINSIDANNLKITRTTTSVKTGNTTNVYTLTSP